TIVVKGKNVLALRSITYQGATLDSSDYEVTTDRIIFTKKFADSLPYGKNEVIVYAMYNPSAMNTPVTVTINKIKYSSEQKFDSREVSVSVDTLETGSISQQYTI
ncbi:MAG: hypothetical protein IKL07_08815, partial [Clostridium sp.]|nr:hypothetical protein [Clostridium sp.]